jgi:chromosome segregation ATPase
MEKERLEQELRLVKDQKNRQDEEHEDFKKRAEATRKQRQTKRDQQKAKDEQGYARLQKIIQDMKETASNQITTLERNEKQWSDKSNVDQASIKDLQSRLEAAKKKTKRVQREYEEQAKEASNFRAEAERLKGSKEHNATEKKASQAEIKDLQGKLKNAQKKIEKMNRDIEEHTGEAEDLRRTIKKMKVETAADISTIAALNMSGAEVLEENKRQARRLKELEEATKNKGKAQARKESRAGTSGGEDQASE